MWLRGQHAFRAALLLSQQQHLAPAYPVFRGSGVVAWAASSLLHQAGFSSNLAPPPPPPPPPGASAAVVDPTRGFVRGGYTVAYFPPERIRNFSIIAHVDHGKSTLADRWGGVRGCETQRRSRALPAPHARVCVSSSQPGAVCLPPPPPPLARRRLLEATGAIAAGGQAQYLDKLQVERERGITVKVRCALRRCRPALLPLSAPPTSLPPCLHPPLPPTPTPHGPTAAGPDGVARVPRRPQRRRLPAQPHRHAGARRLQLRGAVRRGVCGEAAVVRCGA